MISNLKYLSLQNPDHVRLNSESLYKNDLDRELSLLQTLLAAHIDLPRLPPTSTFYCPFLPRVLANIWVVLTMLLPCSSCKMSRAVGWEDCGEASKRPAVIAVSHSPILAQTPPILHQDQSVGPIEYSRRDGKSLLRWGYKAPYTFHLGLFFSDPAFLGKGRCHLMSGHTERPLAVRSQTLLLAAMRVTPEADPLALPCLQMTSVLPQPQERPWATTSQLSCLQVPDCASY